MLGRRWPTVAIVVLLLAPSAIAWSQYHGGPERNEQANLPGGPLDVIGTLDLDTPFSNAFWGSRALSTQHGLLVVRDTDKGCELVVVPPPYDVVGRAIEVPDCNFGLLVGYDEVQDLAILCDNSLPTFPTLRAFRVTTGEVVWNIIPARDLGPAAGSNRWLCLGAAIETHERRYGVGFEAYPAGGDQGVDHVVVMGDLDSGAILWRASIPGAPGVVPLDWGAAPDPYPRAIYPRGVTLTSTGMLVTGHYGCGPGDTPVVNVACISEGFVAWFSLEGTFIGMESGTKAEGVEPTAREPTARSRAVSQYAVASGPIAMIGLGTEVLVVNPEAEAPVLRAPMAGIEPTTASTYWFAGVWTNDLILVPILSSVTALDPVTLAPTWTFTEGLEWRITDVVAAASGETYVLITNMADPDFRLVVLETATGDILRRIPIPARIDDEHRPVGWYAHLVPVEGVGFVVADTYGHLVLLGAADDARLPHVTLSTEYPAPGEALALEADTRGAASAFIGWGDGTEEPLPPQGGLQHVFTERGARDLAITSVFEDGTTATRIVTVDVGGTPPAQLTTLQKAFSAEYQNWTFFVLGTLITVIGLAVTVGRNRRRFSKLERELAAVEEIRMLSIQDPRSAVLALKSYRDRLPEDLAKRRIDDSQYQILDLRSARLLKVLRTRQFSPFDARLSQRYHRLLDAAFEDAILQPSEEAALVAALDVEDALSAADRRAIAAILADFTSGPQPGSKRVFNNA